MNKKSEILAPAGSLESVKAAVRCGANAVYLGTKQFNARINAENFSFDELKETIEYCHSCGVKVHITFNTLISDDEIPAAKMLIKHVCELGADVLILQDIGLSSLVSQMTDEIEKHASTQMSVQTADGINLLESFGFIQAVLPREMSREEIINIKKKTNIKLEAFVHGALCMCVSGQCYLSSMIGGRSGNRGLCAQPCRLPFSVQGGTGHDLSLKDLSLVSYVKELNEIGIDTFKIEGRMKRPEYVAAAVTAVRDGLDSKENKEINNALSAVFSRSGFTDGYYKNELGRPMFGIRTKQDVEAASSKIMASLQRLYDKEKAVIPVSFVLNVLENENISLSASAGGKNVFVSESYIPEKALNKPSTKEGLSERLSKCGGTIFYAEKTDIFLHDGLIVPASVINLLRRKALEELQKQLSSVKPNHFTDVSVNIDSHTAEEKPKFHVRIASLKQIPTNFENVENLYIPLFQVEKYVEKLQNCPCNIAVEVPRGIFGNDELVLRYLEKAKKLGINDACCGTIDGLALAKKAGMNVHTGFSMNVCNSLTLLELEKLFVKSVTLSAELTLDKIKNMGGKVKRGIIAYGRLPLMLTRNCPMKNGVSCKDCGGKGYLTDRMGIKFPIACGTGCSEILNSRPIYMGDRLNEIENVDFITLYFTKESGNTVDAVLDAYRKGKKASGEFTRGLYYREVK